jgi:TPR repeat protein
MFTARSGGKDAPTGDLPAVAASRTKWPVCLAAAALACVIVIIALFFWQPGSKKSAESNLNLGQKFQNGDGVPRDLIKAAALYKKACDGGEPGGCFLLSEMYEAGEGVPQNPTKAAALSKKASKLIHR